MKLYVFGLTALLVSFASFGLFAGEVDHFYTYGKNISDSSALINDKANSFVKKALEDLNKNQQGCSSSHENKKQEARLYKELRKYFKNHISGQLSKYILKSKSLDKLQPTKEQSVFRHYNLRNSFGMTKLFFHFDDSIISPIVRMEDSLVGSDKFEHLFGRGFVYFKKHYLKGKSLDKVLIAGAKQERRLLGGNYITTAVFSYGDLAANFSGMRFWNHLLQKREDVLGENWGPYIECDNNKWKQVKDINLSKYFDASMDESINCSSFPSKNTAKKYQKAISETFAENKTLPSTTCPMSLSSFEEMKTKYAEYSKYILNLRKAHDPTGFLPVIKMRRYQDVKFTEN